MTTAAAVRREAGKLALAGGLPVRANPLPVWPPPPTPELQEALMRLLEGRDRETGKRPASMQQKRLFEQAFATYCGTRFAIAVNSGTTALDLSIDSLDLEPGGVVVASNYGHPSTVRQATKRHKLLLLDVSPDNLCLAPEEAARALEREPVRCVITTHFAGQMGGIEHLSALCDDAGVALIEDASHAHGAMVSGRCAGSFGRLGAFSLQAAKNLSSDEGGVITCSDEELFRGIWRNHDIGRDAGSNPYDFVALGGNFRMAEVNALIARYRLLDLDRQNALRQAGAAALRAMLPEDAPLELLPAPPKVDVHAYHLVPARYRPEMCGNLSRHRFVLALNAEGIVSNTGWPSLLSDIPALRPFTEPTATPVAEKAITESVWLDQRLLFDADGPRQIAEAVLKIRDSAGMLRRGR